MPFPYFYGINIADFEIGKKGKQPVFDDIALIYYGCRLQAVLHIFQVVFYEAGKEQVAGNGLLVQKGTLVFLGFALGLETALAGVPVFACPIGIVESGIPHGLAAFEGVFVCRHGRYLFSILRLSEGYASISRKSVLGPLTKQGL